MKRAAKRRLAVAAWGLVLAAAMLLVVKAFLLDVYQVDSSSMEPVLHGDPEGGERVLVLYRRAPALERFDLAVLLRQGEREPEVKRVTGLPGENVGLLDGDLLIDGRRLGPREPRPPAVPLFDSAVHALEEGFELPAGWTGAEGDWRLDAAALDPEGEPALACYRPRILDGHLGASGERVRGRRPVGDAAIASEVRVEGPGGRLVWRLTEEGDAFEAWIEPHPGGRAQAFLVRRGPAMEETGLEVLAAGEVPFAPGEWHRVRFANIDNALALDLDGRRGLLLAVYDANRPLEDAPERSYRHLLPRACLGGAALEARFRGIAVLRDLHYTSVGLFAGAGALTLGPDEVFVLGDNSGESRDSREWGPLSLGEVIGVPVWVVWPPRAVRALGGGRAPLAQTPAEE